MKEKNNTNLAGRKIVEPIPDDDDEN